HGDAAVDRTTTEPAAAAGLADRGVGVVRVGHRANGREAGAVNAALLTRVEAQDGPTLVATDVLGIGPGGTRDLTALARLHLDVVDDRADRHALERHGVARLHVDLAAGRDHLVAGSKTLGRNDVAQLAVVILDQRDEGGAVRIILQPLDRRLDVELDAAEVDHAVRALVPAATVERGGAAGVVAAALAVETL